jgi:hypothetical protein
MATPAKKGKSVGPPKSYGTFRRMTPAEIAASDKKKANKSSEGPKKSVPRKGKYAEIRTAPISSAEKRACELSAARRAAKKKAEPRKTAAKITRGEMEFGPTATIRTPKKGSRFVDDWGNVETKKGKRTTVAVNTKIPFTTLSSYSDIDVPKRGKVEGKATISKKSINRKGAEGPRKRTPVKKAAKKK